MGKILKKIFHFMSGIQRFILGLLFWSILCLILFSLFYNPTPKVTEGDTLYLNPTGIIVDEYSTSAYQRSMSQYMKELSSETLLSDLKTALLLAAMDNRITSVVMDLSGFSGAGTAVLEDFRRSLIDFRNSGKPIYVYSPYLEQSSLYLSAVTSETTIDPMGEVFVRGYGAYRAYLKDGLDEWGVNAHIYRAGENKSYVEPYLNNKMTNHEKVMTAFYLDDLWQNWLSETSFALNKEKDDLQFYSDHYGSILADNSLTSAKLAAKHSLVSQLLSYDDFNQLMISRVGLDDSGSGFKQINWQDYLSRENRDRSILTGSHVALLYLSGEILWGEGDWSRMGSNQVEEILDQIAMDSSVSALVLRINSPGGSAMGAEMIRRKLEKFHDYGIPLIVSMGNMAASGGYWIACEGDEIWAENTTITGSIGVFSYFFTLEETLKEKLKINVDGYGTTGLADVYRWDRDTSIEADKMIQAGVDQVYEQFLTLVSQRRDISLADLEDIAGGRVWTGRQGAERNLVDHVGGLDEALDSAAAAAVMGSDYEVVIYDDSALINSSLTGGLIPGVIERFSSLSPLMKIMKQFDDNSLLVPEDNPFMDPRKINAWSPL